MIFVKGKKKNPFFAYFHPLGKVVLCPGGENMQKMDFFYLSQKSSRRYIITSPVCKSVSRVPRTHTTQKIVIQATSGRIRPPHMSSENAKIIKKWQKSRFFKFWYIGRIRPEKWYLAGNRLFGTPKGPGNHFWCPRVIRAIFGKIEKKSIFDPQNRVCPQMGLPYIRPESSGR